MYSMDLFFSLREKNTNKLDNYDTIMDTCNYNNNIKKRKVYLWQETDPIEKSLNNILNKLSNKNYNQISKDIGRLFSVLSEKTFKTENIDIKKIIEIQQYICYTLISRAIIDNKYGKLYAQLCKKISTFSDGKVKSLIVKVCEHLFYCEIKQENNNPSLYKFFALLYLEGILSKKIIIYILNSLYIQEQYSHICDIIILLDKIEFNFYYSQMTELSNNKKLSNKIRFKIMDILEI